MKSLKLLATMLALATTTSAAVAATGTTASGKISKLVIRNSTQSWTSYVLLTGVSGVADTVCGSAFRIERNESEASIERALTAAYLAGKPITISVDDTKYDPNGRGDIKHCYIQSVNFE